MRLEFNKGLVKTLVEQNTKAAFIEIGEKMVNNIRNSMQPGSGRKYKRPGGRIHIASVAGKPPAKDYGKLAESISYATSFGDKGGGSNDSGVDGINTPKVGAKYYTLSVGSNSPYALFLELGLGSVKDKPRPYLARSLTDSKKDIEKAFTVDH